ncbi:MAG: DUF4956 domain-containing protein [Pirellulales bacterium]
MNSFSILGFLDQLLFINDASSGGVTLSTVVMTLGLAFCLAHIIAWVYMWTHHGMSYSQSYTSSLVVMSVLVSLVMLLMSGNVYIAFGLMAVFALVRFRNVLKDTRDATFILWAIIMGMAVGTQKHGIAIVGTLFVAAVVLYLWVTSLGARQRFDVVLSLHMAGDASSVAMLNPILKRHSFKVQLASQRNLTEELLDLSYRLLLRNPAKSSDLLAELESTDGVAHVSLYHREDESEM